MKTRDYLFVSMYGSGGLAIFMLVLMISNTDIDNDGIILGSIVIIALGLKSYYCYRKLKRVRDEDMLYQPATDATTLEKIRYYKRVLLFGTLGFIGLSFFTWQDLNELVEPGNHSVRLMMHVAVLYELGGYWLAVLATPIVGIIVCLGMVKIISNLKKKDVEQDEEE